MGEERRHCGKCKHWHQWEWERERRYWEEARRIFPWGPHTEDGQRLGDCDKIAEGAVVNAESSNGEPYDFTFDGHSFEDECYDEFLHCFEEG